MKILLPLIVMLALFFAACQEPHRGGTNPRPQTDSGTVADGSQDGDGADAPSDRGRDGGGQDARVENHPIDAPPEAWTWIEFPGTTCGNGSPAGIGINPTDRSDDLFVYFMGGGACWDVNSCFVLNAAVNIESGYGQATFENEGLLRSTAFDREEEANPFRDMSWVFVPYCTGDLHAGDKVTSYSALGQTREVHHRGGANVDAFLARLEPTFAQAKRVFVSGSSAGGFGAQLNAHRFVGTFEDAEVHVLSDSGPLVQPWGNRFNEMNQAWTLQVPPGCDECADGFPQWFDYLAATYPESRFGLLTYDADATILLYFAYPVGDRFKTALASFIDNRFGAADNAHAFVLAGTQHVLLGGLTTIEGPGSVRLTDWTSSWVDGGEGWTTIRP